MLGRFLRDDRKLLRRLMPDAIAGEPVARKFFHSNFPRHLAVMVQLVVEAPRRGVLQPLPLFQAMSFIGGAVAMPIMMATAAQAEGFLPPIISGDLDEDVLSDRAIAQRVDMAFKGLQAESE